MTKSWQAKKVKEYMDKGFQSFTDFYPFYLQEHSNRINRRLHVLGTVLVLLAAIWVAFYASLWYWLVLPIIGYGLAWVGHFFCENNKPATFKYPIYSLMGDWCMLFDVVRGKVKL